METTTRIEWRYIKGDKIVHAGFVGSREEALGFVLANVARRHGRISRIESKTTHTIKIEGDWE